MHLKGFAIPLLLIYLLLAACVGTTQTVPPRPPAATSPVEATLPAAAGAAPTAESTPDSSSGGRPTLDDPIPAQVADASLAGYIYNHIETAQIWEVGPDGISAMLFDRAFSRLSPDGTQALYEEENDLWVADLSTGERRNLTNTPERGESYPQWWPANPNGVVFTSWPINDPPGMSYGQPSIINLDGSGYQALSEAGSASLPAPGPDGVTLAYDLGLSAFLQRLGQAPQPFNLAAFGLPAGQDLATGSPAWSPDGQKLAWWVSGPVISPDSSHLALVVFDLAANSYTVLHPYIPSGGSGWLPNPVWSPDGQWLAFNTRGEGSKSALYAGRSDGSLEYNLGDSTNPVWSPQGDRLIYTAWPPVNNSTLSAMTMLLTVADGQSRQLFDFPEGSTPNAWLAAAPASTSGVVTPTRTVGGVHGGQFASDGQAELCRANC